EDVVGQLRVDARAGGPAIVDIGVRTGNSADFALGGGHTGRAVDQERVGVITGASAHRAEHALVDRRARDGGTCTGKTDIAFHTIHQSAALTVHAGEDAAVPAIDIGAARGVRIGPIITAEDAGVDAGPVIGGNDLDL